MARRASVAESIILGTIAIIVAVIAIVYYIIVNYWLLLVILLSSIIIVLFYIDFHKYRKLNSEIDQLNSRAEKIRNSVQQDFDIFSNLDEIIKIFDNSILHFPRYLFLDPEFLRLFEGLLLSNNEDIKLDWEEIRRLEFPEFILNKIGLKFLKPRELHINTEPINFLIRASHKRVEYEELKSFNANSLLEEYNMFQNIVNNKFTFSSLTSRKYCIWKLIKFRACNHYSSWWSLNYSYAFELAESTDLIHLVKCYSDIALINHFDKYTITMFAYYLLIHGINPNDQKLVEYTSHLQLLIENEFKKRKLQNFEKQLVGKSELVGNSSKVYTITDTDIMTGSQFENFVAMIFSLLGYKTFVTPASGDQGIDIIAEKNNEKVGIQAKCYSNAVTNSAIQEVKAGMAHYNCTKGIVVTNNIFTRSAIALAESNEIVLWNRQKLTAIINEVFTN